jgi:hypothetical protein
MKFTELIVATGVMGLLVCACAPTAPVGVSAPVLLAGISPTGRGLPSPSAPLNPAVCTQTGSLNPVPFVSQPFDPSLNQTPQPDTTTPVNLQTQSDINRDLTAAFTLAGNITNLQQQLCSLGGIFIDPSGCRHDMSGAWDPTTCNFSGAAIANNSWGLRTYPPNTSPGVKYIGLSLGLWNNKNTQLPPMYQWNCPNPPYAKVCAPPFYLFYQAFVDAIVQKITPGSPYGSISITVMPSSLQTSSALGILAVLAHEFGHVYWFDSFVVDPNTGAPNPGGSFVNKYFCNGGFYPLGNWQGIAVALPFPNGTRWVKFADPVNYNGSDVPGLPGTLHNIYHSGNWASALAAFSPDEDFVETFELFVIWKAGLTTLEITNSSNRYSDYIIDNGTVASALATKMACFL